MLGCQAKVRSARKECTSIEVIKDHGFASKSFPNHMRSEIEQPALFKSIVSPAERNIV